VFVIVTVAATGVLNGVEPKVSVPPSTTGAPETVTLISGSMSSKAPASAFAWRGAPRWSVGVVEAMPLRWAGDLRVRA